MPQTDERRAREQSLASVAAEAVQPVVALGAQHPDDRIGSAVGRRDNRGTGARHRAAPSRRERRPRAGGDPQDGQIAALAGWTRRAVPLESDEHRIGGAIGGGGGTDRISRDALGNEAAAEPAEIGAVEQIGLLVLPSASTTGGPPGRSSGSGLVPPRSASRVSRARQSDAAKKSGLRSE